VQFFQSASALSSEWLIGGDWVVKLLKTILQTSGGRSASIGENSGGGRGKVAGSYIDSVSM